MRAVTALSSVRHAAVGGVVGLFGIGTLTGVVGEERPERFDSKQVVVAPEGDEGVRITEVVDIDFGNEERRGYQRIIPNDFGEPRDVTASAVDAPDDLDVAPRTSETRIRIGDPDVTLTGQHRYTLAYTLPAARISSGALALDIIGTDETLETRRFELIVTGFELESPTCNVGGFGDSGGCELIDDGEVYRAVFEPLAPGDGITIGGEIVGTRTVVEIAAPPLPKEPPNRRVAMAGGTVALGAAAGVGTFLVSRRRGRNVVFEGGAADAAFGVTAPNAATKMVSDAELAELATTEFAPPANVDPWLGRVLLTEQFDDDATGAWISGLAARDVVTIEGEGGDVTMSPGPKFDEATADERSTLNAMLSGSQQFTFGTYSKGFADAWARVGDRQERVVRHSGLWRGQLRRTTGGEGMSRVVIIAIVVGGWGLLSGLASSGSLSSIGGIFDNGPFILVLAAVVPAVVAYFAYRRLLPSRTAIGSALALQTESFRRFLAASEGKHVEWAWEHGMLREYSAWAVALDAADAWQTAMRSSSVPPAEVDRSPSYLLFYSRASVRSSHVKPSSSGSGGGGFSGGGFSGGFVGGGGGGGSSGSW